jgi:hypothetical protein
MKKTLIILSLLAIFASSCRQATKTQSIENTDKYIGIYEYVNTYSTEQNNYIVLKKENDKIIGFYYGTTDEFDEAREGYLPAFFVASMNKLEINKNTITFVLNVNNSDFLTKPINLEITSTQKAIELGYKNWENFFSAKSKRYIGFISNAEFIFFKEEDKKFIFALNGQATKKQAETITEQSNEVNDVVIEQNSDRKVKYFFRANGGSVIFFDDGTAYRCARCELEENLESFEPNITYKEYPTYLLMESNSKWDLYDEDGNITMDWVIVNYQNVKRTDDIYDTPALKMLQDFYTQYITEQAKASDYDSRTVTAIKNKYLTKELLEKLQKEDFDYDPFLYAQDCDRAWLKTLTIALTGQDNAYTVCYYYQPHHTNCITLYLVEKDGHYLINDLDEFR